MNALQLKKSFFISLFLIILVSFSAISQVGGWKPELEADARKALTKMLKDSPKIQTFVNKAYGYAVYPTVTKAGFGFGGAVGKGIVFRNDAAIASSSLKQGTFGLQAGGQQYSEVVFFENEKAFDKFKNGKLKLDGQASAVIVTAGASIDLAYRNGVAIFTRVKGGLMFEASVGGQHFSYKPKN